MDFMCWMKFNYKLAVQLFFSTTHDDSYLLQLPSISQYFYKSIDKTIFMRWTLWGQSIFLSNCKQYRYHICIQIEYKNSIELIPTAWTEYTQYSDATKINQQSSVYMSIEWIYASCLRYNINGRIFSTKRLPAVGKLYFKEPAYQFSAYANAIHLLQHKKRNELKILSVNKFLAIFLEYILNVYK